MGLSKPEGWMVRAAFPVRLLVVLVGLALIGPHVTAPANAAGALEIDADRMEMDDKRQTAVFSGKVRAKDGQMRLTADQMTVHYFKKGGKNRRSGVREVLARGHVTLVEGNNRGFADRMVYRIRQQTLELLGGTKNAEITYGDDRLAGKQIVLTIGRDRHIEKVSVVGGNSKRVSARITPSGEVLNGPGGAGLKGAAPPSAKPNRKDSGGGKAAPAGQNP